MENACLYKLCAEYICSFYYRKLYFAVIFKCIFHVWFTTVWLRVYELIEHVLGVIKPAAVLHITCSHSATLRSLSTLKRGLAIRQRSVLLWIIHSAGPVTSSINPSAAQIGLVPPPRRADSKATRDGTHSISVCCKSKLDFCWTARDKRFLLLVCYVLLIF